MFTGLFAATEVDSVNMVTDYQQCIGPYMASQHKPTNTVCSGYQKTLTASAADGVHCQETEDGKGDS